MGSTGTASRAAENLCQAQPGNFGGLLESENILKIFEGLRSKRTLKHFEVKRRLNMHEK